MRRWIHVGAGALCVVLAACSGDKPKELLETAEFEERQMNLPHARQLYEDVIRLYPASKEAETARVYRKNKAYLAGKIYDASSHFLRAGRSLKSWAAADRGRIERKFGWGRV